MVKSIPGPPEWLSDVITLPDAPDDPQHFYYRDLVECAHYLFGRSDLVEHMDYVPMEVFDDSGDQVYHEMCSSQEWAKQQVSCYLECCHTN